MKKPENQCTDRYYRTMGFHPADLSISCNPHVRPQTFTFFSHFTNIFPSRVHSPVSQHDRDCDRRMSHDRGHRHKTQPGHKIGEHITPHSEATIMIQSTVLLKYLQPDPCQRTARPPSLSPQVNLPPTLTKGDTPERERTFLSQPSTRRKSAMWTTWTTGFIPSFTSA
jgi:hypothetical protein